MRFVLLVEEGEGKAEHYRYGDLLLVLCFPSLYQLLLRPYCHNSFSIHYL